MRRLKKGFCFIVVLFAVFVLQACGNKGEKYVEKYIKEGKYNEVHILVNEFDIEKTGEMGDLIADVDNYNDVVSLLHGQSSENDLEKAKRQILGFNGSYKKYSSFEEDVEELENRIVELENHRNEIEEIIQKIQDSYDSGNYESMGKVITEYKENEMLRWSSFFVTPTRKSFDKIMPAFSFQMVSYIHWMNAGGYDYSRHIHNPWLHYLVLHRMKNDVC